MKQAGKTQNETTQAVGCRQCTISKELFRNRLEFAMHELINELLECKSYFRRLYHSREKGGVENYNGLVRQYFPKGHDLATITLERLLEVEDEINNCPSNILGIVWRGAQELLTRRI